jgi:hypothetical protein
MSLSAGRAEQPPPTVSGPATGRIGVGMRVTPRQTVRCLRTKIPTGPTGGLVRRLGVRLSYRGGLERLPSRARHGNARCVTRTSDYYSVPDQ